ncbi:nitrogen fixation protein FixH [Pseudochelatococcus lubricantis]|uniref:Nitrogen fixation protein FixH n=1 Tax=Pseudochelatococcus lubricantis TaxID=1538102 RepID=A0ABX0UZB2_9HYPH|nr:FixH family protein [Pseudochelatococcus lubricantis]NIJ57718.1 nitrogen fixation protein FixH [Pseudochelatococcus lubricantis]
MPTTMPSPAPVSPRRGRERRLTGRTVLLCLIGFFGAVAAVNVVMIRAAISTHGGAEKISSYRAGLNFARDREAAEAQKALGWQVDVMLPHRAGTVGLKPAGGHGCLVPQHACVATGATSVSVRDAQGRPLAGLEATLVLAHPTDSRRDRSIPLADRGNGIYEADIAVTPGNWNLDLDIERNGEQMFRSSSRVVLN